MDSSAFDYLIKQLKEQRDSTAGALADGRAKDMEEYRDLSGFIRGIDFALSEIAEVQKKLEESDE